MSKVRRDWERLQSETKGFDSSVFDEIYGPLFSNGINIGREVKNKVLQRKFDDIWETVLQADGLDNGLTAGFITSFDVEPVACAYDVRVALDVLKSSNPFNYSIFHAVSVDQLPVGYQHYPDQQRWSMPAIVVSYVPLV